MLNMSPKRRENIDQMPKDTANRMSAWLERLFRTRSRTNTRTRQRTHASTRTHTLRHGEDRPAHQTSHHITAHPPTYQTSLQSVPTEAELEQN